MPDEAPHPPPSFKLPLFTPTEAEIWVNMVEDTFMVYNITDNRSKMLEIRMALTQEVHALMAQLTTGHSDDAYQKLTTYLRKYGTSTDMQKLRRVMVAKRPFWDKTPTEHL